MRKCIVAGVCRTALSGWRMIMRKCTVAGCMPDGSVRRTVMRMCIVAGVRRTALSGGRL